MYVPTVLVSTVLVTVMSSVISPSTSSVAVAPASVYVVPLLISSGLEPSNVITGRSMSKTYTVLTTGVAALPAASLTL